MENSAAPGGKAHSAAGKGTRPFCRGGMPQPTYPGCVGVGSGESSQ